jgi:hypothetical protein
MEGEQKVWVCSQVERGPNKSPSAVSLSINNIDLRLHQRIPNPPHHGGGFHMQTSVLTIEKFALIRDAMNDFWVQHGLEQYYPRT